MKKTLIVYYSHSGVAKKFAQRIAEQSNGTLFEIKAIPAYPTDYNTVVKQAKEEIRKGYIPAIDKTPDISEYSTIIVGTPNWWSSIAPPVTAFLKANDFTGKTVLPCITHGGGGGGHIEKDIRALCGGAMVKPALVVYEGEASDAQIREWLKPIEV